MSLSGSLKGGHSQLCAIDLSKAFDKVNHHALFIKLMRRNLPVALLDMNVKKTVVYLQLITAK